MITRLVLSSYRNYREREWVIPRDEPVVLFGPNGAGKTNVLEAISLFGGSTGLRKAKWAHLPNQDSEHASSIYMERSDGVSTALKLETGTKQYFMNGAQVARSQWADVWALMWLTPEHDRLFVASPETRRQTLDRWVYAFFPEHGASMRQYEQLLRERQKLLQQTSTPSAWLSSIEGLLAEQGCSIHTRRTHVMERLLEAQQTIHPTFPRIQADLTMPHTTVDDLRNAYAAARLQDSEKGSTQHGPHRSDWLVTHQNLPAALHSTGEQKMMVLTLFLSVLSARALLPAAEPKPALIVLLDDIVSHLDTQHRQALMEHIQTLPAQAWLSGTDRDFFTGLKSAHWVPCIFHSMQTHTAIKKTNQSLRNMII